MNSERMVRSTDLSYEEQVAQLNEIAPLLYRAGQEQELEHQINQNYSWDVYSEADVFAGILLPKDAKAYQRYTYVLVTSQPVVAEIEVTRPGDNATIINTYTFNNNNNIDGFFLNYVDESVYLHYGVLNDLNKIGEPYRWSIEARLFLNESHWEYDPICLRQMFNVVE